MELLRLLADEIWRHQEMLDPGGGGLGSDSFSSGGTSSFPYGPADRPDDPGNYVSPPPPQKRSSYYHRGSPASRAAPPPDPWAGIPSYIHDQALSWTDQFAKVAGWPQFPDWNQMALNLAKSLQPHAGSWGAYDAFEWLFNNALDDAWRKANPWARYGMDKDSYNQTVGKLNSVMFDWTGNTLDEGGIHDAIRGAWTPDQIKNFAMYGNPQGSGDLLASAKFEGDMPWLSAGQSYSQTLQRFEQVEMHAPTDKATLAAFFRFETGAKTIGGGQEAIGTVPRQRLQATEVR